MAESPTASLTEQLERALTMVMLEAPVHFAAVRRQLGNLVGIICVEGSPPMSVCVADGPPWVRRHTEGEIELSLTERDLSRMLRGELTFEDGILNGELSARGSLEHLLAFLDGLASWLQGAMRCPSSPTLYEHFFANEANGVSDTQKGPRTC